MTKRLLSLLTLTTSVLMASGCTIQTNTSSTPAGTDSGIVPMSPAPTNDHLTFAVEADPHMDERSNAEVFLSTIKQINASRPAFLVDLGDIFMVDKLPEKSDEAIRGRFELMKGFYDQIDVSIPLHFAMGNHDAEAGWDKVNAHAYREDYFPEETSDLNYYSFEDADSLFIVLDPFSYTIKKPKDDGWGWTLGKTQYDWLATTLAASHATHKFVFIHHLVGGGPEGRGGVEWAEFFEWGGSNADCTAGFDAHRPGWGIPIKDVLEKYGVDAVFKGHDHFYAHQELDGITYQTLPQPSHPGSQLNHDPALFGYTTGSILGGSGFLRVTTQDSGVSIEFVSPDGAVLERYEIPN